MLVGNIGLSASTESMFPLKLTRSRGSSLRHRRVSSRRFKDNSSSSSFRRKGSVKRTIAPPENPSGGSFRRKGSVKKATVPPENSTGSSFRRKSSVKRTTTTQPIDNTIVAVNCNTNNTKSDKAIRKTTFIHRLLGAKARAVSFGRKSAVAKNKPTTSSDPN